MEEIWKPVTDYEGLYEVSNLGRVRSLPHAPYYKQIRVLKPKSIGYLGYVGVTLYRNGKGTSKAIHRLVAKAFINNPNNYPEVNHIDEAKTNNCAANLEWCTSKYNKNYGHRAEKMAKTKAGRFSDENAVRRSPVICIETGKYYPTMRLAALDTGANYTKITECCKGKRKRTGGYSWRYALENEK